MIRFWGTLLGLFFLLLLGGWLFPKVKDLPERGRKVGWVEVHGPIVDVSGTLDWIDELRDKPIRAVFLHIDSPGGTVGGSQALYFALKRLKEEKHIPVIAYIPSLGVSGAYYVASMADKIVVQPGAIVGSIGVIAHLPEYYELGEKIGLRMRTFKAGKLKDAGNPWRPMKEEEIRYFEHLLEEMHAQFIRHVSEGRGLPEDSLRPYADGRVFTGEEALRYGLVDAVGSFAEAESLMKEMAGIKGDPVYVYPPAPRKPLLRRLIEGAVGESSFSVSSLLKPYPQVLYLWTGP